MTWHVKRERVITYHTLSPLANILKHVQNEFLINVAIFAQISDVRYPTRSQRIRIFQPFENAHSESLEARQRAWRAVCVRDIFAETALMSRPFFEIKNSILSVARYTRGIVYLVTQATRPANLVTVRQRAARCEIMISQAFRVHPAFNSTVPLLHYLRALTTSRLKF